MITIHLSVFFCSIRPAAIDFLFRVRRDLRKSEHPEKKGKVRFQKVLVRFQKKIRLRRAFWISHGFKQTNISTTKLHQSILYLTQSTHSGLRTRTVSCNTTPHSSRHHNYMKICVNSPTFFGVDSSLFGVFSKKYSTHPPNSNTHLIRMEGYFQKYFSPT